MVEKLWGGRFEASLDKQTEEFGASIKFEQRLAPFDLKGSLAHVKMLGETGIITTEESKKIAEGLKKVEEKLLNDGKVDIDALEAIAFDPYTHGYYKVSGRVGEAFKDGLKLK